MTSFQKLDVHDGRGAACCAFRVDFCHLDVVQRAPSWSGAGFL